MTEKLLTKEELLKGLGVRFEAPIHFTYCSLRNTLKPASASWLELSHLLTKRPLIINHQDERETVVEYPLFNLATFGNETKQTGFGDIVRRNYSNIEKVSGIVLDIDNANDKGRRTASLEEVLEDLKGYELAYYTSLNHRNPQKGNVDKFRVVLPFDEPCDIDDYTSRKAALLARFGYADQVIQNPTQPYYLPIAYEERKHLHRSGTLSGRRFSIFELEAEAPKPAFTPTPSRIITDEVLPEAKHIYIRTADGHTWDAASLFHNMREGYDGRRTCYRIDDSSDRKPGCYVIRYERGLSYHTESGEKRFIPVLKTVRQAGGAPVDTPTTPLWERKKHPAAPAPTNVSTPTPTPTGEIVEYDDKTIWKMHERFLPSDTTDFIPERGFCFIKSPKGTGKTEQLKALTERCAKQRKRVLLIGHRIYLLQNIAERLNLDFYGASKGDLSNNVAVTIDSLTRIDKDGLPYDTVIIDESEQVLLHLTAKTMRDRRQLVITNLLWALRNATQVVCLDADLTTEDTIELLEKLTGVKEGFEYKGIINDYRFTGRTTKLYPSQHGRGAAIADAINCALDGRRIFIACNSKRLALALGAVLEANGVKTLTLTSETNSSEDAEEFIKDPTTQSLKYQAVVSSPTLSTGVSIDGPIFDTVIGIFDWQTGTYQDADQALSRVRQCNDVRVWIQHADVKPGPSEEEIAQGALRIEHDTSLYLYGEEERPTLTQGAQIWANVYARISWLQHEWRRNKRNDFIKLRTDAGYTITDISIDEDGAALASSLIRDAALSIDEAHLKAIFDATPLSADEYDAINAKKKKTSDEYNQTQRYRYAALLRDNFTLDNLRQAVKERLLKTHWRMTLAHHMDADQRSAADMKHRTDRKVIFTDYRHDARRTELLNELLSAGGLDYDTLLARATEALANQEVVNVVPAALGAMALHYEKHAAIYRRYFETRVKDPIARPKFVWDAVVGAYGLPLSAKRTQVQGERTQHYFIDPTNCAMLLTVAKQDDDERL